MITELKANEVFVFGSNLNGNHAGGAARTARLNFGALQGLGNGKQGNSYAIPTITKEWGTMTSHQMKPFVEEFKYFAESNPHLTFLVTEIGCGIAGMTPKEIAPLFQSTVDLPNVHLPARFWEVLNAK